MLAQTPFFICILLIVILLASAGHVESSTYHHFENVDLWPVQQPRSWEDAAAHCEEFPFQGHLAFSDDSTHLMDTMARISGQALDEDAMQHSLVWTGLRIRSSSLNLTKGDYAWHGDWELPPWRYLENVHHIGNASDVWWCAAISARPIPDRASQAPPYGYVRVLPCDIPLPSLCMRTRRGHGIDAPYSGSHHVCGGPERGRCSILRRVATSPSDGGTDAYLCECRCSDDMRYGGRLCDRAMCFGVPSDSDNVCSGRGTCTAPDKCQCAAGYGGPDCSAALCAGVPASDPAVCSGRGRCVSPGRCECSDSAAWGGATCAIPRCFGRNATDVNVCSGGGRCVAPDTCLCAAGQYVGRTCEHTVCHRRSTAQVELVCGGPERGECIAPDTCLCRPGYTGPDCGQFLCHGADWRDGARVCSGRGRCVAPDTCACASGWSGAVCDTPVGKDDALDVINNGTRDAERASGARHAIKHASVTARSDSAPPSIGATFLNEPNGLHLNGTGVLLEDVTVNGAGHTLDGYEITIRGVTWRRPAHLRHVPLLRISPYARYVLIEDCTFEDELPGSDAAPGILWSACGSAACMQDTAPSADDFVTFAPGGECAPGDTACVPDAPEVYAYNFVIRDSTFKVGERAFSLTYGRGMSQDDPHGDGGEAAHAECHVPGDSDDTWSTFHNATICDPPIFCEAPDEPVGCTNMTEYEPPAAPPVPPAIYTAFRHRVLVHGCTFHEVRRDAIYIGREPLRTTATQEAERALFVSDDICERNFTCAAIEHVHIVDNVFHASHGAIADVGTIVLVAFDDPSAYTTADAYACSQSRVVVPSPGELVHEVQEGCPSSAPEEAHALRQVRIVRNTMHGTRGACVSVHTGVMHTLVADNVCELAGSFVVDSRPLTDALRELPHVHYEEDDPGDPDGPDTAQDARHGPFIADVRAFFSARRVAQDDVGGGGGGGGPAILEYSTEYDSKRALGPHEDAVVVRVLRNKVLPTGTCAAALALGQTVPPPAIGTPPPPFCEASCGECGTAAHVWLWAHAADHLNAADNVIWAHDGGDAAVGDPEGLYGAFSYGSAMHVDRYASARHLLIATHGLSNYDTTRASASAVRSHELHVEAWNVRAHNPGLVGRGADALIVEHAPSADEIESDYNDGAPRRPDWPARAAACAGSCKGPRCSMRCELDASRVRASRFDRCYGVSRFDTLDAALADCVYEDLAVLPARYVEDAAGRLTVAARRLAIFPEPSLAAPPGPLPHPPLSAAARVLIEHGVAAPPHPPPAGGPLHPIRLHGADVLFESIDFWLGDDAIGNSADYRAALFARDTGHSSAAATLVERIELRHCTVRTVAPAGDATFDVDNMRRVFRQGDFVGAVDVLRHDSVIFDGMRQIAVEDPLFLDVRNVTMHRVLDGMLISSPAHGFRVAQMHAIGQVRAIMGGGSAVVHLRDSDCTRGCTLEDIHAEGPHDPRAAVDVPQPSESVFGATALVRLRNIASVGTMAAGVTGGGFAYGVFFEAMPNVPCELASLRELRTANRFVNGVIASVACRAGAASTGPPAHLCRDWCLPSGPPPAWCIVDPATCDPYSEAHGDTCFLTLRTALRYCRAAPSVRIAAVPGVYDERGGTPLRLGRSEFMTPDVTDAQHELVVTAVSEMGVIDAWLDGAAPAPHDHADETANYTHVDERHACDAGSGAPVERDVVIVGAGHVLAANEMDRVVLRNVEFTDMHAMYPGAPEPSPDPERATDHLFTGTARSLFVWGSTLRGSLEPVGASPPSTPDPTPPLRPRLSSLANVQLSAGPAWIGGSSLLGARRTALDLHMGGPVNGEAVVVGSCGADVWGRWLAVTGATRARILGNRCVHTCGAVADTASDGFEALMFVSMRRFPVPAQAIASGLHAAIVVRDNVAAVGPDPAVQTRRYVRLGAHMSGHTAALMFVNVDDIPPPLDDTIDRIAVRGNAFTGYAVGVRLVSFSDMRLVLNEPAGHTPLIDGDARRGMRELQRLNSQAISGLEFDVKRGVPALDRLHEEHGFCNGLCLPAAGSLPLYCNVDATLDPQTTPLYGVTSFRTLAEGIADCIYEPAVLAIAGGSTPHVENVAFPGGRSVVVRSEVGAASPAILQGTHTLEPDAPGETNLRSVTLSGLVLHPPSGEPGADILRQADPDAVLRCHVTLDGVAAELVDGVALRLGRVDARAKVRILDSHITGHGTPDAALLDVVFGTDPADSGRCAGPGEFEMRDTHVAMPVSGGPHPGALWVSGARRALLQGGGVGPCGNHTDALRPACVHISPCHVDTYPNGARQYDPDAAAVTMLEAVGAGPPTYPPDTSMEYAAGGTYTSNPPDTPAYIDPPARVQRTLLWVDVPHMAWCESPAGDFAFDYDTSDPGVCPQRPVANCTSPAAVHALRRIAAANHPGVALRINGWRVPAGCFNATTHDYLSAVRAISVANPDARGGFADVVIGVGDDIIALDPQSVRAHYCSEGCAPRTAGLTPWDVALLAFVALLVAAQLGWFLACGGIQWSLEPLGDTEGGARTSDILTRTTKRERASANSSAPALGRHEALIGGHVLRPRRRVDG